MRRTQKTLTGAQLVTIRMSESGIDVTIQCGDI